MNKIKINQLFILLFVSLLAFSCKTTQKLASYQPLENALLWQIEGNGLKEHSYLFGTIHLIEAESFYWPKGTLAAIEDSEQITFEIDMDEMTDMGAQMSLFSKAMMNDGTTLSDLLSEEDYKSVSDHFSGMGLPMFLLDKIKPMFLTVFAGDIDMNSMQDGTTKSYEMELFDIANDSNMPVHGLESIEYQISVFDSIPYQDQAQMLVEALNSSDTEDDQFQQMMDLYKAQDIQNMIKFMEAEESGVGEFEDLLLNDRNKNWIPIMSQLMNEKQTFFAVGAGHLAGDEGVIHLLRKEGYKLKPLSL